MNKEGVARFNLAINCIAAPFLFMATLKYINYNRKSTDSEDKQMLSIISQEEAAQTLAERDKLIIVDTINESKSAKIPRKRKGFKELTTKIKSGQCNAIICWKLDRLARNMVEGGEIIELLQSGKLQEIRTPFKTYTPNENAILLAVEFGSANQYSRDLSNNVKRGIEKKAKLGVPNGLAPFGFLNNRTGEKGSRTWVVDPERFAIVQKIFQKVLEGNCSIHKVYSWAEEQFHPTTPKRKRLGGHKLSQSYFYVMLRNPIYAGDFIQAGEQYELDTSLPRAITKEQFSLVQRMLDTRGVPSRIKHQASYAGIITAPDGSYIGPDYKFQLICDCRYKFAYLNRSECPKCGTAIRNMQAPKYLSYIYYYNTARKKKQLPTKVLAESTINTTINDFIADFHLPEEFKECIEEKVKIIGATSKIEKQFSDKRKTDRLAELDKRKKTLRDILVDGIISKDEYQQDIVAINKEVDEISRSMEGSISLFQESINQALVLYNIFVAGSPEQKRGLLKRMSSNLIWDEEKLYFSCPKWLTALKNGFRQVKSEIEGIEPEKGIDNSVLKVNFRKAIPTLCIYCTKLEPIFKTNDVARAERVVA